MPHTGQQPTDLGGARDAAGWLVLASLLLGLLALASRRLIRRGLGGRA